MFKELPVYLEKPLPRLAPSRDKAMEDPAYNPLHYAYLLWVDYLRTPTERDKQQLLVEAASTLSVYRPCGHEGEELIELVARAISRRASVSGMLGDCSLCKVRAVVEGGRHKFAMWTYGG